MIENRKEAIFLSAIIAILFLLCAYSGSAQDRPAPPTTAPLPEVAPGVVNETATPDNPERNITINLSTNDLPEKNYGKSIHIKNGEIYEGSLQIYRGSAVVDGEIEKDLIVFGGDAKISGSIGEDVILYGGKIELMDHSRVEGDIITLGGSIIRSPTAYVGGKTREFSGKDKLLGALSTIFSHDEIEPSHTFLEFKTLRFFNWISLLWWLILTLLVIILLNRNVEKASDTLRSETVKSLLTGFIFNLFIIPLILGFMITLIGIPVAFAGIVAWILLYIFAVPAGFIALGRGLSEIAGSWRPSTLISGFLGLIVLFAIRFFPFGLGFIIWIFWMTTAMGATILSKFGTQRTWSKPD